MSETHDARWFGEQIGKSADWVYRHSDEIPHHKIGRSLRFTERDLAVYLAQTARDSQAMRTTGRRRVA